MIPSRAAVVLVAAATIATGCGATVINVETTTTVPVSTVVPRGDARALFGNIRAAAGDIGELVIEGDSAAATRLLEAARLNWDELEPLVVESGVDLREQIETVLSLMTSAVERRRPADADKAYRFAGLIADTIDERLP